MDVRAVQRPLKERYRNEPEAARITLHASSRSGDTPAACSIEVGRAIHQAQAHAGVGGTGTAACSGDLLLGALAACAQITCQMVASASGLPVAAISASVEGDLDLRGTLGLTPDGPVGFESIRVRLEVDAPDATPEQLASLLERTERYCVVLQTLAGSAALSAELVRI